MTWHHLSSTVEYRALGAARSRCLNPNVNQYPNYGGRGIEYRLPSDRGEATRLLIEAIGPRPAGTSLDRIDNEGHYEIGNLRWATPSEQMSNKRKGHGFSAYRAGCRCGICVSKRRAVNRRWLERKSASVPPPHGDLARYRYFACRCDACRAAMALVNARRYQPDLAVRP